MKVVVICFLWLSIFLASCVNKDFDYYERQYISNKDDFLYLQESLQQLLDKNATLFKYKINFTSKRLEESSYINDTTQYYINISKLSVNERNTFDNIMYKLSINYAIGYRDSCKFIFSGRNKDTIVIYNKPFSSSKGILIDTNTYLIFAYD